MKYSRLLIAIGAVVVLGSVNYSIAAKERIKRSGETIYLRLAPVDPRSLMQGDYMALRFDLAREIENDRERVGLRDSPEFLLEEGRIKLVAVKIDPLRVASLASKGETGGLQLRYRLRNRSVWLGTNAMFFEEGTAQRYESARYGEFKVDRKTGEAVLVGLRDGALKPL